MEMRTGTPAGVRVLACRVPVVRSLALANHRLFTGTPPVCARVAVRHRPARTLGAKAHEVWVMGHEAYPRLWRRFYSYPITHTSCLVAHALVPAACPHASVRRLAGVRGE